MLNAPTTPLPEAHASSLRTALAARSREAKQRKRVRRPRTKWQGTTKPKARTLEPRGALDAVVRPRRHALRHVLPHTHESEMQFHLLARLDGLYGYVLLILRPDKWAGITQRNQRSQKNFRPAQMGDLQRLALRPYGEASSTTVRSDRPQCPRPSAAA